VENELTEQTPPCPDCGHALARRVDLIDAFWECRACGFTAARL